MFTVAKVLGGALLALHLADAKGDAITLANPMASAEAKSAAKLKLAAVALGGGWLGLQIGGGS